MDREGSKSQLRHTEPPREKKKKQERGKRQFREICATVARQYIPARTTTIWHEIFSERQIWQGCCHSCPKHWNRLCTLIKKHHQVTLCAQLLTLQKLWIIQYHLTTFVFTCTIPFKQYFNTKYLCTFSSLLIILLQNRTFTLSYIYLIHLFPKLSLNLHNSMYFVK